ncbi:MAG TPA: ArsA-related P-loop ATPase, partial [Solirubrobacteraceae bacterium]|nr:ArsA-related P-loop ATPase [Solirubrobacteraceae bacterium]
VVTIDPARRLAGALGMAELGNEPRRVSARRLAGAGIEARGELWAMMLDPKRTFDELIGRLAPDERTREEILANGIYRELSSAVAGSQEFTAIAKLYDLDRDGGFDAIVLDTPPSRNALDFINAPARLTQFFDGRTARALRAPTGLAARLVGRGTSTAFAVLRRVTGVDLLVEIRTFLAALGGLVDGFGERAAGVAALLHDPATAVVLVSLPEAEPVDEAIAFAGELARAEMPVGAVIVNRMHADPIPPADLAERLSGRLGPRLAERVVAGVRDHEILAARDRRGLDRLEAALGPAAFVRVPELAGDVHDLRGLARVAAHLFDQGKSSPRPGVETGA